MASLYLAAHAFCPPLRPRAQVVEHTPPAMSHAAQVAEGETGNKKYNF